MPADLPRTYDGRYYQVRDTLTARIVCTQPAHGTIAAWAGVQNITGQWAQAGVYATSGQRGVYFERNPPYVLRTWPDGSALVSVTRLPYGKWRISVNGRSAIVRLITSRVWVGMERIDNADGNCSVSVGTPAA